MDAATVGLVSAGATVLAAIIGGWSLLAANRKSKREVRESESARLEAEARAAEADRLDKELARWTTFAKVLQNEINRLRKELDDARDREEEQRGRAEHLQERLDEKSEALRNALWQITQLKLQLGGK